MKALLALTLLVLIGLCGCSSAPHNANSPDHAPFWRDNHYFVWVEGQYVYRLLQWTFIPGHYQPVR